MDKTLQEAIRRAQENAAKQPKLNSWLTQQISNHQKTDNPNKSATNIMGLKHA